MRNLFKRTKPAESEPGAKAKAEEAGGDLELPTKDAEDVAGGDFVITKTTDKSTSGLFKS